MLELGKKYDLVQTFDFVFGLWHLTKLNHKLHFELINSQNFSSNCSVRMEAPSARAHEASHAHGGKNLKIQFQRGLGVTPIFFPPRILFIL